MKELSFREGDIIIREGEESDYAYLLVSGRVEIVKAINDRPVLLKTIESQGQIFGEMGVIDDQPRSATVRAAEDCEVLQLDADEVDSQIAEASPLIRAMLVALVERVRGLGEHDVEQGLDLSRNRIESVRLEGASEAARQALVGGAIELTRYPFRVARKTSGGGLPVAQQDLLLEDEIPYNVSRVHFAIVRAHEDLFVVDEGSRLGTIVNDVRIGSPTGEHRARCDRDDNLIVVGLPDSPFQFRLLISRK